MTRPTDCIILNVNQRKKAILGKVFNVQHDLLDMIFKDSFDNKFNNFINIYERSANWADDENLMFEVKSDFRDKIFLQWNHGARENNINVGMKFPGYITYIKEPTKGGPHKIIDIDVKNLVNVVDATILMDYERLVHAVEDANLNNKLLPAKDVATLHDLVMQISGLINDEYSKYSWVGGIFWGGKGFSYWGDWSTDLMDNLVKAGMVDEMTNTGDRGYHAQRISSVQFFKPTLVTNYHCNGDYSAFKYCCPAFFMLKGNMLDEIIEKYYKMNFVSTFKSMVTFETQMKWQDDGNFDIKLWDAWRVDLKRLEDEIKTLIYINEPKIPKAK